MQRIARKIRTTDILNHSPSQKNGWILWEKDGESAPVILFNPHAFPITVQVQINAVVWGVTDSLGRTVAVQTVRVPQTNHSDLYNSMFLAPVPAWGYAVYYLLNPV